MKDYYGVNMPKIQKKFLVPTMVRMTEQQSTELENLRMNGYNKSALIRLWIQEGLEELRQKRALKNLSDKDAI